MRNHETAGHGECRTVLHDHSWVGDHTSALRMACDQIMVILELPGEGVVVIGCLAEIDSIYITFDYLVIGRTLEDRIDAIGTVLLKRDCDDIASLERILCVVVSDSGNSESSLFGMPIRRCVLRRR